MPKSMRVKTRFEARDDISRTAKRIEKNTRKMNSSMQAGFRKSRRSALGFKSVLKGILAASVIQKGFGALSAGIGEVSRQFIGFDDAITAAAVRFKDIGPDAKNFEGQLNKIKDAAKEAGATTIFTAEQSAKALDFLARAGFTSAEAMGSLGSMINLSIATGEDFAAVADMSSDLLGAFGLNANNTAQKIANLNRLNDVLVKTTNSANVTVENMFETMKQVGPIATGVLGASLEEVSALTAVLGNSGIKGSDAMTALKNAYLRLAAPVGAGAKILKKFGINLKDGSGGAKKMTDVMLELREKIKGLGRIPQAEVLNAIFGKRAIAGGKNILDNISNIKKFEETLKNAAGTSQKTADIMQRSLGNQIKKLGSAFVDLGFSIITPFETDIKNAVTTLTGIINKASEAVKNLSKTETTSAAETRGALDKLNQKQKTVRQETVEFYKQLGITTPQDQRGLEAAGTRATDFKGDTGPAITRPTDFRGDVAAAPAVKGIALKQLQAFDKSVGEFLSAAGSGGNFEKNVLQLRQVFRNAFPESAFKQADTPLQPAFAAPVQPNLNVNVETNINAEGVTADTTVKAPGTSGGAGKNKF